jgi:hypothetical protein
MNGSPETSSARLALLVCACLSGVGAARAAESAPAPPCAGRPPAAPATAGTDPSVTVWHAPASSDGWQLASCRGLTPPSDAVLIEVSGRFRHEGDALSLLARIGTVSDQTGILYWSVGEAAWRELLIDASALSGPELELRRPDFTLDDLRPGARLHMLYDDDEEPGPVVFETEVKEAGPDGFVTVMRNATAMRLMGMSIADPGDISSLLSVRRVGASEFDYDALTAVALSPIAAAMVSDASHANRAVASYRYLAGIPGDRDPPAMLK